MSERMDGWRECADPEELAAAVAAGVEVRWECDGEWHRNCYVTADKFAASDLRYRVPASWSWSPEPVCRHCHGAGYIDTSAGTVACDCVEPPAPDDLVSRARRHADTHPESRDLTEALLADGWHDRDCGDVGGGWPHPASAHPDGCEAVWLPTDVVDAAAMFGPEGGYDEPIAAACREAQARRGTTPTPSPVPPWPGAVLSGCVDEDGVPTWLAQAGQVRGEQARCRSDLGWDDNDEPGGYIAESWVEVRAPRAVPVPETERVNVLDAIRNRVELTHPEGEFLAVGVELREDGDLVAIEQQEPWGKAQPVAPDGTVEVLRDGDQ